MPRKLTLSVIMVVVSSLVVGLSLMAKTAEKARIIRIPQERRALATFPAFGSAKTGWCEIANDDGNVAFYYASFDSGTGLAAYLDPAQCTTHPYPFRITDVHFSLFGMFVSDYLWPVNVRVNLREAAGGSKCDGPGSVLCSQDFSLPSDSGYPRMMNLTLSPPCCVMQPFFVEVIYQSHRDTTTLPSLLMDDSIATAPDTCNNWFVDSLGYHGWVDTWGIDPLPGNALIRATGYANSVVCESLWYWKPDTAHAPSGMPDFDQYQFGGDSSAMCGPTSVANCLWWFDAVPSGISPPSLIRTLSGYFHTRPDSGTYVDSIGAGLNRYFQHYGFNLYQHKFTQPEFHAMEDSLKKCQDVILLLGFYQEVSPGSWKRFGGHYVTMAGVCSESLKIALSDPFRDAAEAGWPGQVRPPDHLPHPGGHLVHNDSSLVSHDIYQSDTLSLSPGNPHWWLPGYQTPDTLYLFEGKNFQPGQDTLQGSYIPGQPVATEVEYAIMICPREPDTCWYFKPDTTNAPSGMPDFDQYQFGPPDSQAFCGPAAVANCLWWYGAVPQAYQNDAAGFIRHLAGYFHTRPDSGTYVDSIQSGLTRYFAVNGFPLRETTYFKPAFHEMEDSLKACQDIILLLGFWQLDGGWHRVGGHFVTMSGVCSESLRVALSDPARDAAEGGWPGRVRPLAQHPIHPIGSPLHNNPLYVSHDMFPAVEESTSPGDCVWGLPDYHLYQGIHQFEKQNFQPGQWEHFDYFDTLRPTYTEVEYAIMICPKPSAVEDKGGTATPQDFQLLQNHPNPFNGQTVIKFDLLKPSEVTLVIYNTLGERVKTLAKGHFGAGTRSVSWDGKDENGKDLASGIYFYALKAGEVTQTKRMVLLK
ncbi:MAG: FlgD immunoglobulin-like domain containing protein [Candidatus Zixiibacteriota bacterium]